MPTSYRYRLLLVLWCLSGAVPVAAQSGLVPRFALEKSGLSLERPTRAGVFFDVVGRRAGAFGYENRSFEVWAWPMKLVRDFELSFRLENYPLDIPGPEVMSYLEVRPEATILTYTHSAFTVRQILFAPIDEPGVVMLLDIDSALPLTVTGAFRPDLRLMWPAGLMTGNLFWEADHHRYGIVEESRRFAAALRVPEAEDVSVMPYQEEPRDVPNRFVLRTTPARTRSHFYPIVVAGSVNGYEEAAQTADRLLTNAAALYRENVRYYRDFEARTTQLVTPDERLNTAFAWAKVGTDKGMATNPLLGTGLVAGFRTAGNSERPGFAWFFGRDALWTSLALNAMGDFAATRTALDFLRPFQRADGKIPHEISQSAPLMNWFEDYPYPWASADATPLFIVAHADYWRASGDTDYIRRHWDALVKAYRFTQATDTDDNRLVENDAFGHGWVEGGELYPTHEELYQQGAWIEAARSLAELASVVGDRRLAAEARQVADSTLRVVEQAYWVEPGGFYAFDTRTQGQPGRYEEDTVLPAVPMAWGLLDDARSQRNLDRIGAGSMATDWGARILSRQSRRYDPLSYHYGSVWPLFTGWASMGAYRYGRTHIGQQALYANALLTWQFALGYVTELLSGDYNTPFGRSSHHQVWSEAMVITPAVRGLLGVQVERGAQRLRLQPQLPGDWDHVTVRQLAVGPVRFDLTMERRLGRDRLVLTRTGEGGPAQVVVGPALPLDAEVYQVTVNGQPMPFEVEQRGDNHHAFVTIVPGAATEIVYDYQPGTAVYGRQALPAPGARNEGLRVLRARAEQGALYLLVEGLGGQTYPLFVRTPHTVQGVAGVTVDQPSGQDATLGIAFPGTAGQYVRREIRLPLQ